MATRVLPGAYVTLQDLSYFPEGETSLTVGYVLRANKGAVNEAKLVTNPTDFVTKYSFTGAPTLNDDPTFWSILKVLAKTNQVYVVRAASNPLYGGAWVKQSKKFGTLLEFRKDNEIKVGTDQVPVVGEKFIVEGTGIMDGYYTVKSYRLQTGEETVYVTTEEDFDPIYIDPEAEIKVCKTFNLESFYVPITPVKENIKNPDDYPLGDNLMLITGADPGAYNGEMMFEIISSVDRPDELPYPNTMQLLVRSAATRDLLATYTTS